MLKDFEMVKKIAKQLSEIGGRAYFVGGFVRDRLLYGENHVYDEIDIEVHSVTKEELINILRKNGEVIYIGNSFGIFSLKGYKIDIALPRREKRVGELHTDFEVYIDPFIGEKEASKRRDFTINSIMQDVISGEIVDPFFGINDLENKIIRYVNKSTFIEDPLRVLRAAQFASRLGFNICEETLDLCRSIDITKLSKERVFEELKKALLKSEKPSLFFENLDKMGHLEYWFNEIKELQEVEQNAIYHKEGNVYVHTMMVIDAAVKYRDKVNNPLEFMLSALCHDLGKKVATVHIDGKIKSIGHEIAGVEVSESFLRKITNNKKIILYVKNMTLLHMKPNIYSADNSKVKSTNKMFFDSADPEDLIFLSFADREGRISTVKEKSSKEYLFERLDIFREYMKRDYVTGDDLINCGLTPGKNFKKILEFAHEQRMAGVEKSIALSNTIAFSKRLDG